LSYGVAARSLGKLQEAEKQYKRVLSINAKNIGAIYNLAVLESDYKKNFKAALKLFNDVVRLNPKDPQLRKRLVNRIEVVKIQIQTQQEMEAAKKTEASKGTPAQNVAPPAAK
ncbi:MAG: tetratricopeptide repeat protein, partial [Bradymonadia bacterium]